MYRLRICWLPHDTASHPHHKRPNNKTAIVRRLLHPSTPFRAGFLCTTNTVGDLFTNSLVQRHWYIPMLGITAARIYSYVVPSLTL